MGKRAGALWIAGYAAALGLLLALQFGLPPYDDAFFFKRFALNFIDHGVFAWNIADGPVYGDTSQLFQLLVTGVAALTRGYTVALTRVLLALSLLVGASAMARRAPSAGARIPIALAFLSPVALATPLSGMETALVLGLEGLFIAGLWRASPRPGGLIALALALYLARPDTALLTLGALALRRWPERRQGAATLAGVGLGLAAILLALRLYYGTALPLSFYVKSGLSGLYDAHFLARSAAARTQHLAFFAVSAAPLLLMALAGASRSWRLLAPALAFVGYHLLFTVDVMGLHGRFFAPALPLLAAAAAVGLEDWRRLGARPAALAALALALAVAVGWRHGLLPDDSGWSIGQVAPATYLGFSLAALAALLRLPIGPEVRGAAMLVAVTGALLLAHPHPPDAIPDDARYARRYQDQVTSWRGLDQLERCLGGEIQLYHSEIGVPGLRFPQGRVTDLGGLMNPEMTLAGVDFETLCQRDQPAAIFLPHRNYRALNAAIQSGQCLTGYQRVVERGSSPLYIRRDLIERYRCP